MILGLVDILKMAGFDERKTTKLVRHQSQYDSIEELRRNDWLEIYQAYQKKSVFHKAKQIISFYGLPNNRAGFYGVYEVQGHLPVNQGALLVGCPTVERWRTTCEFFYVLKHDERFNDFRDRLIIDWGAGALAWQQATCTSEALTVQPVSGDDGNSMRKPETAET